MATWDELESLAVERRPWTRQEAAQQRKQDRRASMCDGKTRHRTERDAHGQARGAAAYLNIYLCEFCEFWHVGKPA